MILITFLVATIILALLTLLPLWRHESWWVRTLDFPRLQLLILSGLLLLLQTFFLDKSHYETWGMIFVAIACLFYHAWWIIPYTPFHPSEVKSSSRSDSNRLIRIMTANVLTPNRNVKGLIRLVHENQPDILVTLESDSWWQTSLDTLEDEYPFTIKCPLDNLYGMHVYSKFPLTDSQIDYLVDPDIPSMHSLVSLPTGDKVRVHFLHPAPPSPIEKEETSERDAELIIVAKSVAESDYPVIVTGDLNDVAWSETTRLFRKISGLLDPRVGRGMFNTFHAKFWFLRWPLDHLFHSKDFTLSQLRRLPNFGSDHFALFSELSLESNRFMKQRGLDTDVNDLAWASEKADEQGVNKKDVPQPGNQ
jgi:endonuclease/exonuclease/phosphatase (EEP) superfamily protein YafD